MHFGSDPTLPTHGDNSETGIGKGVWVLLLFPLVPILFGAFLPTFGGPGSLSYFYIPMVLGFAWIAAYVTYLTVTIR